MGVRGHFALVRIDEDQTKCSHLQGLNLKLVLMEAVKTHACSHIRPYTPKHTHTHTHTHTSNHTHTHSQAHTPPSLLSPSELSRLEGGMAAPRSFFISLSGLFLVLYFSRGSTTSGSRRSNQERCGFKVRKEKHTHTHADHAFEIVDSSIRHSAKAAAAAAAASSPVSGLQKRPVSRACPVFSCFLAL